MVSRYQRMILLTLSLPSLMEISTTAKDLDDGYEGLSNFNDLVEHVMVDLGCKLGGLGHSVEICSGASCLSTCKTFDRWEGYRQGDLEEYCMSDQAVIYTPDWIYIHAFDHSRMSRDTLRW
ncbi:uncharacterized protein ARMOST_20623 [Armillaria ostoyae]|uniref:Uncharacterized protein n=1 Tax=Armillaria ostoyae TaxID=47428 RepID=A0A284S7U5_ARMOS|nr:uncharacterized protein ARMOST_20623 [Armillaria ostoyae]